MDKKKIISIFGTRPEAIKMAPLIKKLEQAEEFESIVLVTAQHREMLDQVLTLFGIIPDYDLNLMKKEQTLTDITAGVLKGLQGILASEKPDLILVHGDTTTTFSAALAGFYGQIPVGHVEAGLRSYNRYSPYPEEINRRLTAGLCNIHFAPTLSAKNNLIKEGYNPEEIFVTGNTVIDALLGTVRPEYCFAQDFLDKEILRNKKLITVTAHRRENLGEPLENIFRALKRIKENFPETEIVFPVHKNPKVALTAERMLGGIEGIHLIEPMDYEPFAHLMAASYLVLTDSGGLQEEAPALGKPVLVLRDNTERPEAISAGTVALVGTEENEIFEKAKCLLTSEKEYAKMAEAVNPYGDGRASERIIEGIRYFFSPSGLRPKEWTL